MVSAGRARFDNRVDPNRQLHCCALHPAQTEQPLHLPDPRWAPSSLPSTHTLRTTLLHDEGSGPVLVYVPGIDGSGELLLETAERLRERFRLVQVEYVDGVGYGKDVVADLAASLRQVLDKLGIERALLLAESFGGPVALKFALENSEVVRGMAIVNSFAYFPRRFDLAVSRVGAKLLPSFVFRLVRPLIAARKLFGRLCEPEALRRFKARETPNFDSNYRTRLRAIREIDLRPGLAQIAVPVVLYASERDRVVPSVACLTEMQAGLQDATLKTIPDGGHVVLPLQSLPWCEWLLELHERSPA